MSRKYLFLCLMTVLFNSCSDTTANLDHPGSNYVTPAGKEMESGYVSLSFPKGAVTTPTQVLMKVQQYGEKAFVNAIMTDDDFLYLPYNQLELWPQDITFQQPVTVTLSQTQTTVFSPIAGKDTKSGSGWSKAGASTSRAVVFSTTNFGKYVMSDPPSKDRVAFVGPIYKTDPYRFSVYDFDNSFMRNTKAVYDGSINRYVATLNLFSSGYVVYLYFVQPPVANKTYDVPNAYANGYGLTDNSYVEVAFSSACPTLNTCQYYYRCQSGKVKYIIENGQHKVMFRYVAMTDPTTKETMELDGYALLRF
ncbi:MAG: hypothetical protein HOP08_16070 [Cyclobacteriaceae bacterium]|nr:hypothetical protein [Cyclobacteriaceae bacterium]